MDFGATPSTGPAANLPSLGGVYLTNAGTKTVTIDALTPGKNLAINSLNIWASTNTTNTLLLELEEASPPGSRRW